MPDDNGYAVRVEREGRSWRVVILDPAESVVAERACTSEVEARAYASTVRQHIYWLSGAKFRQYYRLEDSVS